MPGSTGTLEEVSEIISLIGLELLDAPCILFNLNGFYDDLRALLNRMSDMGAVLAVQATGHPFRAFA